MLKIIDKLGRLIGILRDEDTEPQMKKIEKKEPKQPEDEETEEKCKHSTT